MSDDPTIPNVPHHGGRPSTMLRQAADFLDAMDDAGDKLVVNAPEHKAHGLTLTEMLTPHEREMQSDLRWLADRLDELEGDATDPDQ